MSEHKQFLKELSALTRKHKVKICGCGCCGSPWLAKAEKSARGGKYEVQNGDERLVFVPASPKPPGAT